MQIYSAMCAREQILEKRKLDAVRVWMPTRKPRVRAKQHVAQTRIPLDELVLELLVRQQAIEGEDVFYGKHHHRELLRELELLLWVRH